MCHLSDTAVHPADNIETCSLSAINERRDSSSTQLTWNYDKNNIKDITSSGQQKSIQYADELSSTITQSTLKLSKNIDFDNESIDEDKESLKTVVVQPKSALLVVPNSSHKTNGIQNNLSIESSRVGSRAVSRAASLNHIRTSPAVLKKYLSPKERLKNALCTCFCTWDCWPPFVKFQVSSII